ncbi:uncharacterized protein LOC135398280 [Ornithodoros turicata]|uniref:uncharacterized protein LOC135398280 n=1 Tax=Ornithodoros turicata TaxID=34597 RepID=UPI003138A6E3
MGSLVSPKRLRMILRQERLERERREAAAVPGKEGVPPPSRQEVPNEDAELELLRTVDLPQPPDPSGGKKTSVRMLAAVVAVSLLFIGIMGLTFYMELQEDHGDAEHTRQGSEQMEVASGESPTAVPAPAGSTRKKFWKAPRTSRGPTTRASTAVSIAMTLANITITANDTSAPIDDNSTTVQDNAGGRESTEQLPSPTTTTEAGTLPVMIPNCRWCPPSQVFRPIDVN